MKIIITLAALSLLATGIGVAEAKSANGDAMKACGAQWSAMKKAGQTKGQTYANFSKTCLSAPAAAPAAPAMAPVAMPMSKPMKAAAPSMAAPAGAPMGASAKCKDGTFSMSKTHSGTCSHHGGVAAWL